MVEGQPKEIQTKKPKELIKKVGKVTGYLASAYLAFLGISQFVHAESDYDQFLVDNPDVVWAQTQISDFNTETNRVFLELDRQGLNGLGERFPSISAARLELEENEGKIPDPLDDKTWGIMKVMFSLYVGGMTKILTLEQKKTKRKKTPLELRNEYPVT